MPTDVEFLARDICRKAGYDPDQIVVDIDQKRDFDYLYIGLAPVDIKTMQPIFMKFIDEAERKIKEGKLTEEGSYSSLHSEQVPSSGVRDAGSEKITGRRFYLPFPGQNGAAHG